MADHAAEFIDIGTGGVTTTYKKMARDSGGPTPPPADAYVYWQTTDPNGSYGGVPPYGGPLVDDAVLGKTTS